MIEIVNNSVVIDANGISMAEEARAKGVDIEAARKNSLSARILAAHNTAPEGERAGEGVIPLPQPVRFPRGAVFSSAGCGCSPRLGLPSLP